MIDIFTRLFGDNFDLSKNAEFILAMRKAQAKRRWPRLIAMWREAGRLLSAKRASATSESTVATDIAPAKRRRLSKSVVPRNLAPDWRAFLDDVSEFEDLFARPTADRVRFTYVEGPLVAAVRNGHWVLLDEINLATPETLEALTTLLQRPESSVVLVERGDLDPIPRHVDFRLFACMNPATDVGKRDLPPELRSRFTEIHVSPPDAERDGLLAIISGYLGPTIVGDKRIVTDIANFYTAIRGLAQSGQLADGSGLPLHYSMRTLSRALSFAVDVAPSLGLRRAVLEGLTMAFATVLGQSSSEVVQASLATHIVSTAKNPRVVVSQQPKPPASDGFVRIGPFYVKAGPLALRTSDTYVITNSVQTKMVDLARAITTAKYPVLIQGPTSSGKTSIIEHLAGMTGHRFVRINNHEHTDIQEYVGTYTADAETGRLVFSEGILVRALKRGDWVVLDELNLAPSDVLEALNRLLDDNRELFVAETQEVVRPHPHFMLFATQNPPGIYGGRKVLSRAFRNRFLELHFDDVPRDELETILCQRCRIAPSYASKIVAVFAELQRRRQTDRIFDHRQGFVTLRDLFRWGGRGAVGYQQLAEDGYMLLAERSRRPEEADVVKSVIEQVMRVVVNPASLYSAASLPASVVDTKAARRVFSLVTQALANHEPVLLVGNPGSGKTSICDAVASVRSQHLRTINMHQNSEVADLLGSQRPVRNRSDKIRDAVSAAVTSALLPDADSMHAAAHGLHSLLGSIARALSPASGVSDQSREQLRALRSILGQASAYFTWIDGPVIEAMRQGDMVLLDEISLADDSVLERLNSLLEPDRTIMLVEKAHAADLSDVRVIAHDRFELVATMNPGGDYGKKELSPALRNRFTEIWVPLISEPSDRLAILASRLAFKHLEAWAERIVSFSSFYCAYVCRQISSAEVSLRDALAWCDFMVASSIDPPTSFVHGARLAVLDRLGTTGFGQALTPDRIATIRRDCKTELYRLSGCMASSEHTDVVIRSDYLQVGPFRLSRRPSTPSQSDNIFILTAPTVAQNIMRILRALEVSKPLLLEGSPGVGKTSTIVALARVAGRRLRRINLSDQTDLLDLLGADIPVEGGAPGEFAWKDAAFLHALKTGEWVLLDEMNLASQQVLEGLNACLDYRGSVFIPELGRTYIRHPDFRVFAAQNPHHQGGARKGLPRSLVDRFTVVFMDELIGEDSTRILASEAGHLSAADLGAMIRVNDRLTKAVSVDHSMGLAGAPWEFNLRDLKRWLQAVDRGDPMGRKVSSPAQYFDLIYSRRFRTPADRLTCAQVCEAAFPNEPHATRQVVAVATPHQIVLGHAKLAKTALSSFATQVPWPDSRPPVDEGAAEAFTCCLRHSWLPILVGPPEAGATSLVQYVARHAGAALRTIALSSGSDTSDLLGGFEQRHTKRSLLSAASSLRAGVAELLRSTASLSHVRAALLDAWGATDVLCLQGLSEAQLAVHLGAALARLGAFANHPHLEAAAVALKGAGNLSTAGFEWVDGALVTAMKRGEWLVVSDANMCSNSVLDRLNPVFEDDRRFVLTERGMVDGEVQTIEPHPDFRVIFCFDPRHGELSRAMRNRGIEIALLDRARTPRKAQSPFCAGSPAGLLGVDSRRSFSLGEDMTAARSSLCPPTVSPCVARQLLHADEGAQGRHDTLTGLFTPAIEQPLLALSAAARLTPAFPHLVRIASYLAFRDAKLTLNAGLR